MLRLLRGRGWKKYLIRLAVCLLAVLFYTTLDRYLRQKDREYSRDSTFTFRLPFPAHIVRKYDIPTRARVERVILAGNFSEWDATNPAYAMQQVDRRTWRKTLSLGPGQHPYKYVVYLAETNTLPARARQAVWCPDMGAKQFVNDGYGGRNSVLVVRSTQVAQEIARIVFIFLITGILAYSLLEFFIHILMRRRLSLKYKFLIVVLVLVAASNAFYIFYSERRKVAFARKLMIDKLNIVHSFLLGNGIDFSRLQTPEMQEKAQAVLGRFLGGSAARFSFSTFSNKKQPVDNLFLLDPDGRILAWSLTQGAHKALNLRFQRSTTRITNYFQTCITNLLPLSTLRQGKKRHLVAFNWEDHAPPALRLKPDERQAAEEHIRLFRYDTFIYPVYSSFKHRGYYLARINPRSYSELLAAERTLGLVVLALILLLGFLLIRNLGRLVLQPLQELTGWTRDLVRGEFDTGGTITTGDELETLADDFNQMRAHLADNLDTLKRMSLITGYLQRVRVLPDLYQVFLTFITANFGFRFNRAAIFLVEGQDLQGAFAVGCLDLNELQERFGGLQGYRDFDLSLDAFLTDYRSFLDASESRFAEQVRSVQLSLKSSSLFCEVCRTGRYRHVSGQPTFSETDETIRTRLNLQEFLLLPLYREQETAGVLLVDQIFGGGPISRERINRLQILVNQFSVILDNAYILENLERTVAERTGALRAANRKLREIDRNRSNFFTNVSHETKTPLTLISNYLEKYIRESGASPELMVIKQNIDKLRRDMVNFLDGEKLKRGQVFYKHDQVIDLCDFVAKKLILFREMAEKKEVCLEGNIPDPVYLKADAFAMDRVINNLLDNAIKFTPQGGRVEATVEQQGKQALIRVTDTGIGISRKQQKYIFEPYHQVSHEKRSLQGIGMGLFIVHKIIESLQGTIQVKSSRGRGTEFRISLPAHKLRRNDQVEREINYSAPIDVAPAVTELQEGGSRPGNHTLLFVEDNINLLYFLQTSLHNRYNIYYALSGQQALEKLEQIPKPDVIISDVMMDEMDGMTLFRTLSTDRRYRDIPFVFLSAKASLDEKLQGLSEGAIDYIFKPFTIEELVAKVNAIIRQNNLKRTLYQMDKYAAVGRLVAGISHEVFNPLSGIKGPLGYLEKELAAQNAELSPDLREAVSHIHSNMDRIERIIKSLKVLYYHQEIDMAPVDLARIVDSILIFYAKKLDSDLHFVVQIEKDTLVRANHDALTHILINLIDNAIDAVAGRGEIRLEYRKRTETPCLVVSDNGCGILSRQQERIFDAFFTTKPVGKGTGLGLFIVRDLVVKLGWSISVASEPGTGTSFTIEMGNTHGHA